MSNVIKRSNSPDSHGVELAVPQANRTAGILRLNVEPDSSG